VAGWRKLLTDHNWLWAVRLGQVPGVKAELRVGRNPDISTASVPETIWVGGGEYPWQQNGHSLEVLSDSADDTLLGTGARTFTFTGLDENWEVRTVTVDMDGVTPVAIPGLWCRLQEVEISSAGSTLRNQGTITTRVPGPGDIQAVLEPGTGLSTLGFYTVPAGKTAALIEVTSEFIAAAGGTAEAIVALHARHGAEAYHTDSGTATSCRRRPASSSPKARCCWLSTSCSEVRYLSSRGRSEVP
jgi:hypothetical protein